MNSRAHPEDVAPGVVRLATMSRSALFGEPTNCYVVATELGGLVVDPGSDDEEFVGAVEAVVAELGGMAGMVVTHGHRDHWEGVARLWERHGGWVATHPALVGRLAGIPPTTHRLVREDHVLAGWRVLEVPGHTRDHIALWRPRDGVMLVGDVVAGRGTTVISPPDGEMTAYLATLRRLRDLGPRLLLPGHGPPVARPREALEALIRHRLAREEAVWAALDTRPRPLEELVACVYADVPAERWWLAEHSLLAHLLKLEAEGRAVRLEGGWARSPAGRENTT
ncbi:MAG: MBL fold metallo-hydrolase [Ardenticatenia bacterium]|nr:MBL fold metallo-hydrolase [Ardenticatenia bacterium]